jgi:hypothetical protein
VHNPMRPMEVRTTRPSRGVVKKLFRQASPVGVDVLAHRQEHGLDLFTGLPKTGDEARDWYRLRFEADPNVTTEFLGRIAAVHEVTDGKVSVVLVDGRIHTKSRGVVRPARAVDVVVRAEHPAAV